MGHPTHRSPHPMGRPLPVSGEMRSLAMLFLMQWVEGDDERGRCPQRVEHLSSFDALPMTVECLRACLEETFDGVGSQRLVVCVHVRVRGHVRVHANAPGQRPWPRHAPTVVANQGNVCNRTSAPLSLDLAVRLID